MNIIQAHRIGHLEQATEHPIESRRHRGNRTLAGPCKGKYPLFDSTIHNESIQQRDTRHAAAILICGQCPITEQCLTQRNGNDGIYGGQLFTMNPRPRHCQCGTKLPDNAPPYRKHCNQACGDAHRDRPRRKTATIRTVICECGTQFQTSMSWHKYCSAPCRKTHSNRTRTRKSVAA